MKELYGLVDDHITQYENGTITISDDIPFSMRDTVQQISHYILSSTGMAERITKTLDRDRSIGLAGLRCGVAARRARAAATGCKLPTLRSFT